MPLTDALPYLPELPVGSNSTNGTFPVPGIGDIPAPFDILGVLTFSQTSFTLLSSLYIAWQNLTQRLRENENLGLNIIASLNNRSESILEIEREEGETTSQTANLVRYDKVVAPLMTIVYRIRVINNEPFLRRWIFSVPISNELRELSAKAEKLYQLYLIKVNVAIFADADRARNGVEELQKKMDKVLEALVSKQTRL
ncbi:hypothetical protein RhiXN_09008 [Rhizoctonia solani]|uniref:Uncharacterized protein n=1 Tax=Rhizoctonia solani TaxID=456999 RepID=A0A8H8NXB6_9AGAM|nr:uncharacterized protein RhiXN_09008 [Rhizoctonia solani]QRW20033.1 hypothetical protein RhiXN_09008 [Rhizoctonia solani]